MLRALNLCQDTSNNHLSMDSGYDYHSCINLPYRQDPNKVDSSINLFEEVILPKVVTPPTTKPRSVGPHKLIPKKNRNKRKSRLENKKFRSVSKPIYGISKNGNKRKSCLGNNKFRSMSKPLYGISADHNNNNGLKPQRHLLYKSEDKNKYPLMDTSTSIPIVCWKTTKKKLELNIDKPETGLKKIDFNIITNNDKIVSLWYSSKLLEWMY